MSLFKGLADDSLLKLGTGTKTVDFPPAETICQEGDPGGSMYIIQDGLVEIRKKEQGSGTDFVVARLGRGAALGEMSLVTGRRRSASAIAVESTSVLSLTRADFEVILAKHPEISLGVARLLAERLEEANKQVGVPFISLRRNVNFDPKVVQLLPEGMIWRYKMVPVAFVKDTLSLAMVNPADMKAYDAARQHLKGVIIEPKVCREEEFMKFMEHEYPEILAVEQGNKQDPSEPETEN